MILALRALGLGDLLTAVPALRALRRFTDEPVVLAAPPALEPLVRRLDVADRLLPVPSAVRAPPAGLPAPSGPVRIAVNLHGVGPQSTDALRRLEPVELWAYGEPAAPAWRDEHEVDRWCRLVAGYGCQPDRDDLYLADHRPAADPNSGPVLIHPGAADPSRRWPAERFATVARRLATSGLPVRVTAGPGEEHLAARVASLGGLGPAAVASGLGLGELTTLVTRSRLLICGDTGVAHLATACRTPSVLLFGPQPPDRWGPPRRPWHHVFWSPDAGSGPLSRPDRVHPGLLAVGPGEVVGAAHLVLANDPRVHDPAGQAGSAVM